MNEVHNIKMLRRICGKEGPTKWEDTLSLSLYCGLNGGSSNRIVEINALLSYGLALYDIIESVIAIVNTVNLMTMAIATETIAGCVIAAGLIPRINKELCKGCK